ncbi:MAG TPA: hypothetical protein VLA92_02540, partial [Candidatus Saccharimonadales bacterium]|nr:hypothetical protein [Candidatus Saccharimonadales bacterium]
MGRTINKIKGIVGSALMLMAVAATAWPATVSAAAGNPVYCDAEVPRLNNQNIGTEVPVILVHGLQGNDTDWGSISNPSSFAGKINNTPGVAVAHRFDYNWNNWVTDADNGPRLAKTIDCVSRLSVQQGGKGKVVVVGYSMGGLMAREALSHRSSDGQRAIADEVGQVVTIGTPHAGAEVTPWCGVFYVHICKWFVPGSNEMNNLPQFPNQTIVHTIAGDVTRVYYNRQGQELRREQPHDDMLVTVSSAHAAYTIDASRGGGEKTFNCQKGYLSLGIFGSIDYSTASCEHGRLMQTASNGVREDTVDAIKKYVAWLNTPTSPSSKTLTVGGLTTTYDSRWRNADYGASGPGQDLNADDTTNGAACTNCQDTPPPTINAFIQVSNLADWCSGSVESCAIEPGSATGSAPAVTIGGKAPTFSARYVDSGYQGGSMVWCFEEEKICVYYRRAV